MLFFTLPIFFKVFSYYSFILLLLLFPLLMPHFLDGIYIFVECGNLYMNSVLYICSYIKQLVTFKTNNMVGYFHKILKNF